MISSIEIIINNLDSENYIKVDLSKCHLLQVKNDVIIRNEKINIDFNSLSNLIKTYMPYWDNEYIDNKIIDGKKVKIKLNADNEIIHYHFKNKFPNDYNIFIDNFKKLVGAYEY